MRTITISTDTFAALWAKRHPGEETEDAILQRVLGVKRSPHPPQSPTAGGGGIRDERNGVEFPEGFEIFRIYKGRECRARATNGRWLLNDGSSYPSLHKLSSAIVTGNENSWNNWKYTRQDGSEALIAALRDETKVIRRAS